MTDGFPVVWEEPGDPTRSWALDRQHFPRPVAPLDHALWRDAFGVGLVRGMRAYGIPVGEYAVRRINTFQYTATIFELPDGDPAALFEEIQNRIGAALARQRTAWTDTHLPEILEHLRAWEAFDLEGASTADLLSHLDMTVERLTRLAEIHFLVVIPAYMAMSEFEELYARLIGGGRFDAYRLLQGFGNKTVESGHALWQLSRLVRRGESVERQLREFLETYGHRGDLIGVANRYWIEDATPVINTLREYAGMDDDQDPATELARLAAEREEATAMARKKLADASRAERDMFELLLFAAREGTPLTEDHGFYIDFRGFYQVRRVALEFGRRFASGGLLDEPGDVVMLSIDEIRETLRDPIDRCAVVRDRREEMRRFADVRPPETLGAPMFDMADNPIARAMTTKFFGAPVEQDADTSVVKGHPGAAGVARGIARVVRNLADAERLRPGDVLVAETTSPPWTPLFAVAAAVVTDAGGVLSHCAVVAREYGIPAVVGCGSATVAIRDGQTVEVDGDAGVVRLLGLLG